MTFWAHRKSVEGSIGTKAKEPITKKPLDPPRDWIDAFSLRRITQDPNAVARPPKPQSNSGWLLPYSKTDVFEGPNILDSHKAFVRRLDLFLGSGARDLSKRACLKVLLGLAKSAQKAGAVPHSETESQDRVGLEDAVKKNYRDLAHFSAVHSGRIHFVYATAENLDRARTIISRFAQRHLAQAAKKQSP